MIDENPVTIASLPKPVQLALAKAYFGDNLPADLQADEIEWSPTVTVCVVLPLRRTSPAKPQPVS